jgi:hypothetical protein
MRLISVAGLLTISWLVAGVRSEPRGLVPEVQQAVQPLDASDAPDPALPTGPWGRLELTRIVISPPIEYLPREWAPPAPPRWVFPASTPADVARLLSAAGMQPSSIATVMETVAVDPPSAGVVLSPDRAFVIGLDPETRGKLYLRLGASDRNRAQEGAFRYFGTADEWLGENLSPATRQLVDPLLYSSGGFMFFADLDLIRAQIATPAELQRLVKRLLRQATVMANLHMDDVSRLGEISEYWGRGGRRTDIRPLLESLAEKGRASSVDISHLLPTLARQHLYRYPKTTSADLAAPLLANCYWTALNFFKDPPDPRFLDLDAAMESLKNDYFFIHDGLQLGDIVTFADKNGRLFHVAVHIADDLVFGKNGGSPLAPWSILPLEQLKGHYIEQFLDGARVGYLRRKDL